MGTWESSGTPKISEFDCKGQNTSHWEVLYIIGNLSKFKCPKWARMTHLDICNTSYGQKKGRESNWQFDSRPWKVKNRPDYLAFRWRATRRWKAFDEGYNFGSDLVPIRGLHQKLSPAKLRDSHLWRFWDSHLWRFWDSRDKKPLRCHSHGVVQSIICAGRWWLLPSPGRGESCESKVARGLS
jgi:hypothetical protein